MQTVIYVRTAVDYTKSIPTINEFLNQTDKRRPLGDICRLKGDLYEMWDRFFSLRYPVYRTKVRAIAEKSLKATGLPIFRGEYSELMEWQPDKELIIVPSDDDDWVCPGLAKLSEEFGDDTKAVVWPHVRFTGIDVQEVVSFANPFYRQRNLRKEIKTNNYALRRSFLLEMPCAFNLLHFDGSANRFLIQNVETALQDKEVSVPEKAYSMYNRHVGSITVLASYYAGNGLESHFSLFCCREKCVPPIPEDVVWAKPYIEEMEELSQKLIQKVLF
jgi:hypothetical protein